MDQLDDQLDVWWAVAVEVGLFEAKNRLSELVAKAEGGEEVVITRRGLPVAKLVPAVPVHDRAAAMATIERMRRLRESLPGAPVTVEELIAWKNEGRR